MGIDIAKLENVIRKPGGKIIARCPACALEGNDTKGEHLAVFPDGRFGCVVYPQDKAHTKEIFKLVGLKGVETPTRPFDVQRVVVPPSVPIMDLGRFSIDRLKNESPALPDVPPPVKSPEAAPPVETLEAGRGMKTPPIREPKPPRIYVARPYLRDGPGMIPHDEAMSRSGGFCVDSNRGATAEEIRAFLAAYNDPSLFHRHL